MMEKTIRMLKDKGIFGKLVKAVKNDMEKDKLECFLKMYIYLDEELKDQWCEEAKEIAMNSLWNTIQHELQEQKAVEALDDVDIDALYEKATGHRPDQEQEEDCDLNDLIDKVIMSICKNVIDDFEKKEGC